MKRQDYDHTKLTGMDADLETSLKEYGFAWIETDEQFLFYYGINYVENSYCDMDYNRFDFNVMDKKLDIKKEYDWIENWNDVNSYIGCDIMDEELPRQIHDLFNYYGKDCIFGSTYWEGLRYDEIVPKD